MRSRKKSTITAADVQSVAMGWIQAHLVFADYSRKCTWPVLISVLLFAATRRRSVHEACERLRTVPSDETIRNALWATLPTAAELERRINAALADRLPHSFFKWPQRIAADLTHIPYHGRPHRDPRELRRSKPKGGTTRFHVYATAYVVRRGHRFTVAATRVLAGETMSEVVRRLLRQVRGVGIRVRFLLLDKGFYSVEVVRYLQAARCPFLIPAFPRSRRPARPRPGTLHALAARSKSGWERYTWTNPQGRRATVEIAIACRNYAGRRGRRGRFTQLYACWGLPRRAPAWIYETYRLRFGIESSYRQMNEARIRTSSRNPLVRFLYVAIALILRNVWVWCHLNWLGLRYGLGIQLREPLLRFSQLLLWLQTLVEQTYALYDFQDIPPPQPLSRSRRSSMTH